VLPPLARRVLTLATLLLATAAVRTEPGGRAGTGPWPRRPRRTHGARRRAARPAGRGRGRRAPERGGRARPDQQHAGADGGPRPRRRGVPAAQLGRCAGQPGQPGLVHHRQPRGRRAGAARCAGRAEHPSVRAGERAVDLGGVRPPAAPAGHRAARCPCGPDRQRPGFLDGAPDLRREAVRGAGARAVLPDPRWLRGPRLARTRRAAGRTTAGRTAGAVPARAEGPRPGCPGAGRRAVPALRRRRGPGQHRQRVLGRGPARPRAAGARWHPRRPLRPGGQQHDLQLASCRV